MKLLATAPKPAPAPSEFIPFLTIEDPQADGGMGYIPFSLWPAQLDLLNAFHTQRKVIVLKARQLGISWLSIAYAYWLCAFHPVKTVLIFSKGELEANELIRRISGMHHRFVALQEQLRSENARDEASNASIAAVGTSAQALEYRIPELVTDNMTMLVWANGSRIQSMPATKSSGSSFTASLLIADEFAKMMWAEELYTAAKPTVDGGGKMFIVFTANGYGNLAHKMWGAATRGENGFVPVFLPWWSRPGRTKEWYAEVARDAVSQAALDQEYPATPEDAFAATGAEKFLPSILLWDLCKEELPLLTRRDTIVLCADAGVSNDNFALIGVSRHPDPARHDTDVAVRFVDTWVPPKNGRLDFQIPETRIRELCARGPNRGYSVVQFTYDPYQLYDMAMRLQRDGVVIAVPFNQGGDRLTADKQLLDVIQQRRIAHDGNQILRQHLDNADRKVDAESHKLRIVKREPSLKIDAAVALSMASYRCLELPL